MKEYDNQEKTDRCPLCGADNQCAMAAGQLSEPCWCIEVTIDPAALAAVPEKARGRVCLCPACAEGKGEAVER
jgi:hypothetical protein